MTSAINNPFAASLADEAMPTLLITRSTELLEQTSRACQSPLAQRTPPLNKVLHASYLARLGLMPRLPRAFVGLDASRTWMMYWTLCALKLLGEDISAHRQRYVPRFFLPKLI
jgi:protein farnesyltransferase subunit beta